MTPTEMELQSVASYAARTVSPEPAPYRQGKRIAQLTARRGKHTLLLGAAGLGKTALVNCLQPRLNLLVCPRSEHLVPIFDSLEAGLDLAAGQLKLLQRKKRVLLALATARRTVVFDGVGWTTPKLSSFLQSAMEHVPVWICTRSEHPWDIGHFWSWLVRFEKIDLRPLRQDETRELIAAAVEERQIPSAALEVVGWLHRRSNGSPLILRELFHELTTRSYDLRDPLALRRLDLDRRVRKVFPDGTANRYD